MCSCTPVGGYHPCGIQKDQQVSCELRPEVATKISAAFGTDSTTRQHTWSTSPLTNTYTPSMPQPPQSSWQDSQQLSVSHPGTCLHCISASQRFWSGQAITLTRLLSGSHPGLGWRTVPPSERARSEGALIAYLPGQWTLQNAKNPICRINNLRNQLVYRPVWK